MIDNRNMLLAVVLSIAILLGFQFLYPAKKAPPPEAQKTAEQAKPAPAAPSASTAPSATPTPAPSANAPSVPGGAAPGAEAPAAPGSAGSAVARAQALGKAARVRISNGQVHGSIALEGARIDDITLANYHEHPGKKGGEIVLLSPKGSIAPYYAQFGWVADPGIKVPGPDTIWTADKTTLGANEKVTLRWDNGEGIEFTIAIGVDRDFMFTVAQGVRNRTQKAFAVYPYGLISRTGTPKTGGIYILHEGPVGVLKDTLKEISYEDLRKSKTEEQKSTGGWAGITDKYWLTALIPDQKNDATYRFIHRKEGNDDRYQIDFLRPGVAVAAGGTAVTESHLFAGAKVLALLDNYQEKLGITRFDLAIDFGWFYFLTKPIFYALIWLNKHVGNFGIAILILTVFIKLLFFPLANKSYVAMSKMKKLQPEMVKLRERFGDDKQKLNQEMMALYKREKANPASGCLPIVIQIPVFFALYKVLYVTIEMRHAPFYGWIHDLSAPDPTTLFNFFGLIPWTPPHFLMIGVWPIIMGITMFLQQKMNPQPADPIQAKIFLFLPLMFTFLLASFPAGLVIYWAWNNTLSMLQQWVIMRRMGVPAT